MVITRTTRNRLIRKGPWVRIPPSPPESLPIAGFMVAGFSFGYTNSELLTIALEEIISVCCR